MTMLIPLFMILIGAIVYAMTEGKASEMGRLCLAAGLFGFAFRVGDIFFHIALK